jgi:ribosomal protein S18 acetylase RimI-like enzyme
MIRLARSQDIDSMLRIERSNFGERAFSRRQFNYYVKGKMAHVLDDSGVIAGYIVVFMRIRSRVARINVVSVDPALTGMGYGSKLLDEAEALYWCCACDVMSLEVNVLNYQAIKLYKRRGYEAVKTIADYYGKGETAIRMIKELK